MRTLVIGARGMLGQEFVRQLQTRGRDEVVGWGREELDITNETEVMGKIAALKPGAIFNCTAYNNVDKAEDEPEAAMAINGEAVGYLARAAADCGAVFVHFSTDYVFSGQLSAAKKLTIVNNIAEGGYTEEDVPDPISVYGRSKALGEQQLFLIFRHPEERSDEGSLTNVSTQAREILRGVQPRTELRSGAWAQNDGGRGRWYIIRTSKLFGPAGTGATSKKSFPEIMIKIAKEKGRVEAVDAEAGSPTYVKDLADATLNLIGISPSPSPQSPPIKGGEASENSSPLMGEARRGWNTMPSGVYHLTNSGSCTWYECARAALEYAGLSNVEVVPVGPDHFPRKARRPAHVVLFNTKLPPLRSWQEALKEFLAHS